MKRATVSASGGDDHNPHPDHVQEAGRAELVVTPDGAPWAPRFLVVPVARALPRAQEGPGSRTPIQGFDIMWPSASIEGANRKASQIIEIEIPSPITVSGAIIDEGNKATERSASDRGRKAGLPVACGGCAAGRAIGNGLRTCP